MSIRLQQWLKSEKNVRRYQKWLDLEPTEQRAGTREIMDMIREELEPVRSDPNTKELTTISLLDHGRSIGAFDVLRTIMHLEALIEPAKVLVPRYDAVKILMNQYKLSEAEAMNIVNEYEHQNRED